MSRAALATILAHVSSELAEETDEDLTASRVCELAVELLDGCDHADVAVRTRRGRWALAASSSPVSHELTTRQLELREGPTHDAMSGLPVRCDHVPEDDRWPAWRPTAVATGARSVVAFPLGPEQPAPAVLTLYGHQVRSWAAAAYEAARLFSVHAAVALGAAHVITGLENALTTRHQIGVAQGILMERHRLTVAQAFTVLQRYSNTTNVRLEDVAAEIVRDLDAPGHDRSSPRTEPAEPDPAS